MTIRHDGHWGGDPFRYCSAVSVYAEDIDEAEKLALLNRVLSDPLKRDRLLDLAGRIEAEDDALAAAAP